MPESVLQSFSIRQAASLSGLNKPMVDYLCRQGIMEPSLPTARGRGRQRRYTFGDVVILRVLEKLLAKGVSVKRLKESLISLRKFHPDISPDSLPASYLVTDGEEVFMLKTADTMETLDKSGQLAFAFILELEKVRDEVNLMIHELTATGGG